MKYTLLDIRTVDVKGKTVFLRMDTDVPLSLQGDIKDDMRLSAGMETLEYLLKNGATVIIGGKLGRPDGVDPSLSLEPVAKWFAKKFRIQNSEFRIEKTKLNEFDAWKITDKLFLLENLQFYKEEKANDHEFSKRLASLADVFVNDAFAMCHRHDASIVGITQFVPSFAGFHLQKEILELTKILENPRRPLVVIIGGKKVETKLPLVKKMYTIADFVLVGGKIAQELDVVHIQSEPGVKHAELIVAKPTLTQDDITAESLSEFLRVINNAHTVVWNGPLGNIGANCAETTKKLADAIIKTDAYKVIGGGDTVEFLRTIGLEDKFNFISTGGGAMLAFLSGETLPGLKPLAQNTSELIAHRC